MSQCGDCSELSTRSCLLGQLRRCTHGCTRWKHRASVDRAKVLPPSFFRRHHHPFYNILILTDTRALHVRESVELELRSRSMRLSISRACWRRSQQMLHPPSIPTNGCGSTSLVKRDESQLVRERNLTHASSVLSDHASPCVVWMFRPNGLSLREQSHSHVV